MHGDAFERFETSRGGLLIPVLLFLLGAIATVVAVRAINDLAIRAAEKEATRLAAEAAAAKDSASKQEKGSGQKDQLPDDPDRPGVGQDQDPEGQDSSDQDADDQDPDDLDPDDSTPETQDQESDGSLPDESGSFDDELKVIIPPDRTGMFRPPHRDREMEDGGVTI